MKAILIRVDKVKKSKYSGNYIRCYFKSIPESKDLILDVADIYPPSKRFLPYLKEQSIFSGLSINKNKFINGSSNFTWLGYKKDYDAYVKKNKWHKTYLNICKEVAEHSHCERKKVGSCLVKDNRIISFGYNGTPTGHDNSCEENDKTIKKVLHAETNCILKCAQSTESTTGSTLYCTLSPCYDCSKIIIQSGIKEVYFLEKYCDEDGLYLLKESNIYYEQIVL